MESQADLIGGEGELGKLPRGAHNLPGRSRSQGHLGKKALEDVQEELQTGTRIQFWTWRRTRLHWAAWASDLDKGQEAKDC